MYDIRNVTFFINAAKFLYKVFKLFIYIAKTWEGWNKPAIMGLTKSVQLIDF